MGASASSHFQNPARHSAEPRRVSASNATLDKLETGRAGPGVGGLGAGEGFVYDLIF